MANKTPEQRRAILRKLATVPPEDDDWLWWWVSTYLGIDIPRKQVCENHVAPFHAFADAYFARCPVSVWKASRGYGGKTFLAALLSLTEAITLGASISILGGSSHQSMIMQSYLNNASPRARGKFWEAPLAPTHIIEGRPTQSTLVLKNGGHAVALAASQTSVRGRHPHRLRVDEADSAELDIIKAALGQTMQGDGVQTHTLISSTHQNPDGPMTWALNEAREKGWHSWEWCYRESMEPHGWLSQEEVARKKVEVPSAMWVVEYENQEPALEGRIFTEEVLQNLFDKSLGVYEGEPGRDIVIVPAASDKQFFTGADFARREDYSVFHTMLRSTTGPDMLAAWQRVHRVPWPVIISRFNARLHEYPGASMHDETGIGDLVGDYLTADSEGFNFSRMKESWEMYSSYVAACEAGEILYPRIRPLYEAHRYVTVDQLFGPEHVPDEIVAAALAWRARTWATFNLQLARL